MRLSTIDLQYRFPDTLVKYLTFCIRAFSQATNPHVEQCMVFTHSEVSVVVACTPRILRLNLYQSCLNGGRFEPFSVIVDQCILSVFLRRWKHLFYNQNTHIFQRVTKYL